MSSLTEIRPCTTFATFNAGVSSAHNTVENIISGIVPEKHLGQMTEKLHARWGYQLNHGGETGETVVHYGAKLKKPDFLRIILNYAKAPELLSIGSNSGAIPLHCAVDYNNIVNAHILISLGSPINITTTKPHSALHAGATPLDFALRIHSLSITVLLRLHGGKYALPHKPHEVAMLDKADGIIAQKKPALQEAIGQYVSTDPLHMIADYAVHLEELND